MEQTVNRYTVGEEIFNSVTHGVGTLLGVIGTTVLVTLSVCFGNTRGLIASLIYGISLVLLYTMSTLYHAFTIPKVKKIFRVFDHTTIYLLIAGSYTPFTLITLQGTRKGNIIFVCMWLAALVGVGMKCISVDRYKNLGLALCVVMGWAAVFAIGDICRALPPAGVALMVLGGVSYTGGIAFYKWTRVRYMHSVWHLFVLAGSILHYLCILLYVLPTTY